MKNHYDTFKVNIFSKQNITFNKDQNLISNNRNYSQYSSKLIIAESCFKIITGDKIKKKQRNITTAVSRRREKLNTSNHNLRIHTSGQKRNILGYNFENKARNNLSPSRSFNKSQKQLKNMLDYQIAQEGVRICYK